MIKRLFIYICLLLPGVIYAQDYSVSGKLTDAEDQSVIVGATVLLTGVKDSTERHFTATTEDGSFKISGLSKAFYKMRITSIGYKPYLQFLRVSEAETKLGNLPLEADTKVLSDVEITGEIIPVQQKGDTTMMAAKAYKTNPDANAEDLVAKMPGIMIKSGTVQAQGEDVKKVLVDGKEFFSNDPSLALKSIPAEIIDRVEVFDQLSDQAQFTGFDDGNTTKTINIVTRPDRRQGKFGKAYAGYGTDERYSAGLNLNSFDSTRRVTVLGLANNINQQNFSQEDLLGVMSSGGRRRGPPGGGGRRGGGGSGSFRGGGNANNFIGGQQSGISETQSFGINFDQEFSKKLSVNGSYFFNRSSNNSNQNSYRETFLTSDSSQFYNEYTGSNSVNNNHRLTMRMEYEMDDNNSVLFMPRLSFQNNSSNSKQNGATTSMSGQSLNETYSDYDNDRFGYNFSGTLLYRHKFAKKGRTLSLDVSSSVNDDDGEAWQRSQNIYYISDEQDSLNQFIDSRTKGHSISGNLVYTEPLGEYSQLELNYNLSKSFNDAQKENYDYDFTAERTQALDTALSNNFESTYLTSRPSIGWGFRKEGLSIRANLAYQNATLSSDQEFPVNYNLERSFNSLLPGVMMRYRVSRSKNFGLFFRTSTSSPSISQLQNVVDNSDPLFLSMGNANLDQSKTSMLNFRYSNTNSEKASHFFVMLMAQNTADYVTNATYVATADSVLNSSVTLSRGAQLSTPVNLDGYWNTRAFGAYGFPISKIKSNINTNLSVGYTRTPGITNNQSNISRTYSASGGVTLASNINENVDFTVSYNADYNYVINSLQESQADDYVTHTIGCKTNFIFWKGMVFRNDLQYLKYSGYDDPDLNVGYVLWNMSLGKKFLKNDRGELSVSVFDLLANNTSISRTNTESYIEETRTDVLQTYFLATFTYTIRSFGKRS
ncbi:outer membrane beta-barrel protein [Fulvivirga ligni]|uniref:outer membrane beta-barrel protein n=1 Tax=Fulvivirga ligni TaxID=2904246 RepID=UPI001F3CACDA|nr:outer membrane beta-barrel protein [Fulvivirga ligni]UII19895.1 outer membrane beta-barrel protein [Fulvivirga ligni]